MVKGSGARSRVVPMHMKCYEHILSSYLRMMDLRELSGMGGLNYVPPELMKHFMTDNLRNAEFGALN